MTYEEAEEYMNKNISVIGEPIKEIFQIKLLVIAPKERPFEERFKVVKGIFGGLDNKMALQNLGWINENHDVYILYTEGDDNYFASLLYDYLSTRNQSRQI